MVKFHTATQQYDYPFPAVSLAYFLRYPNPYSTHVLSTDVISRTFDPLTHRLHTVRLHLKRSKLPPAVLKLLPKSILGPAAAARGDGHSFVLEKSTIDVREGWMETESRNLEWTGILSVVERQRYDRDLVPLGTVYNSGSNAGSGGNTNTEIPDPGFVAGEELNNNNNNNNNRHYQRSTPPGTSALQPLSLTGKTSVTTTVTFESRFGQPRLLPTRHKTLPSPSSSGSTIAEDDDPSPKKGFFSSWSTAALQRTIEATGVQRTRNALAKSKEGMIVVLERLRTGGLVRAMEGMRRDRDLVVGGVGAGEGGWKRVWERERERGREDGEDGGDG